MLVKVAKDAMMTSGLKRNKSRHSESVQATADGNGVVKIWDSWIRLFHWIFAGSIIFLLLSGKVGLLFFEWHRQIGECVLGLILFRILWGFFGSSNASLLSLIASPKHVIDHLQDLLRGQVKPHRGHNSAGGWAVLLMLALILFQGVSGSLIADEEELMEGRFYGLLDESATSLLWDLHQLNANLILGIVLLHVVMIGFYWVRAKQNLVAAMITGKLHWPEGESVPAYRNQNWWMGFGLFCLVLVMVGWVFNWFR